MRKILAIVLISVGVLPPRMQAQEDPWNVVQDLPQGTRLKLTLSDGADVVGIVAEVRPDAVVMNNNKTAAKKLIASPAGALIGDNLTFQRSDVTTAAVVTMALRYAASGGSPNPASVRQVVSAAGIGKPIRVTAAASKLSGRVTAIGVDDFGLQTTGKGLVTVRYGDVLQVERPGPGLSKGAKIGIATAIIAPLVIWAMVYSALGGFCGCS